MTTKYEAQICYAKRIHENEDKKHDTESLVD